MAVSLVGMIVAFVLAGQFFEVVAPLFEGLLNSENGANILGFLVIFGVVMMVTAVTWSFVRNLVRTLMLGWIDKGGGLVVGMVVSLAVLSAVFSLVDAFPILGLGEAISDSPFGTFLVEDFDVVLKAPRLLPDDFTTNLTGI